MMRVKKDTNCERNEYLYHNTELLLKKYREVVFSIEIGATQAEYDFESEIFKTAEKVAIEKYFEFYKNLWLVELCNLNS